jgi:hypothetical protein
MAPRKADKPTAAPARNTNARRTVTLERAEALCPSGRIADSIAASFGLDPVDFDTIVTEHETALNTMVNALASTLNERAMKMHLERIVGALVSSAVGAGEFYTQKVTAARDLTTKLANEDRDEDRDGVAGFESKAQRAREFAADMGLQAYAQLAGATAGVKVFRDVTGEDWKPYVAETATPVGRQAAEAQLGAFG